MRAIGRCWGVTVLVGVVFLMTARGFWAEAGPAAAVDQPRRGGVLRVGIADEPKSLEPQLLSTGILERLIGFQIFETLLTLDARNEIVPLLAESMTATDDGKVYTIKIRKGVKFHNGREMTSADVVASLQRWMLVRGQMARLVGAVLENPDDPGWVRALDQYTVQAKFVRANSSFLQGLVATRQGAYIIPKEIVDRYGKRTDWALQDYIGTGPFRLQRWMPGRAVRLQRFESYVPRSEPASGYAGQRVAYVDAIEFVPIPDPSVRAAELEVGRLHLMVQGSSADFPRLRGNPNLVFVKGSPSWYDHMYFNLQKGPFAVKEGDRALKLRQAVLAALDVGEIARATYGDPSLYRLDPGMMWKETLWWSDSCKEFYNQANSQKAKQLLQEAGYRGERILFRFAKGLGDTGTYSEVVAKQLKDVGFNLQMQVMDPATYAEQSLLADGWELSSTIATFREDPLLMPQLPLGVAFARPSKAEAPELHELMQKLIVESNLNRRRAHVAEFQCVYYRQALHIRLADVFEVRFMNKNMRGYKDTPQLVLWNVWLDQR